MSVSTALSNALSGLTTAARRAEVVADNVANAMTPEWSAREVRLSARGLSGGVSVEALARRGDPALRARLRLADAGAGAAGPEAAAASRLAAAVGGPGDVGSLAARAAGLGVSLSRLVDTPESAALQADAVGAAGALARGFVAASAETQAVRAAADDAIAVLVADANAALAEVERLNRDIVRTEALGGGASRELPALFDARDAQIDRVAAIVPLRTAPRPGGAVALYAPGGAVLLDGPAARLGFARASGMTADSTLGSGALSGLTLDGRPIATGRAGPLAGGALAAQFEIRDGLGVEAQARLDALAAELVARFEAPGLDPTLAPGAPGLFTDAGAPLDPTDTAGLAGRLAINAVVDPGAGGEARRLRDGLASAAPGPAGDAAFPRALLAALEAAGPPPADAGLSRAGDFTAFAEGVAGVAAAAAARGEETATLFEARRAALARSEAAARGVESDAELADLLAIEQAYAANARVISVADDLLRTLLEI